MKNSQLEIQKKFGEYYTNLSEEITNQFSSIDLKQLHKAAPGEKYAKSGLQNAVNCFSEYGMVIPFDRNNRGYLMAQGDLPRLEVILEYITQNKLKHEEYIFIYNIAQNEQQTARAIVSLEEKSIALTYNWKECLDQKDDHMKMNFNAIFNWANNLRKQDGQAFFYVQNDMIHHKINQLFWPIERRVGSPYNLTEFFFCLVDVMLYDNLNTQCFYQACLLFHALIEKAFLDQQTTDRKPDELIRFHKNAIKALNTLFEGNRWDSKFSISIQLAAFTVQITLQFAALQEDTAPPGAIDQLIKTLEVQHTSMFKGHYQTLCILLKTLFEQKSETQPHIIEKIRVIFEKLKTISNEGEKEIEALNTNLNKLSDPHRELLNLIIPETLCFTPGSTHTKIYITAKNEITKIIFKTAALYHAKTTFCTETTTVDDVFQSIQSSLQYPNSIPTHTSVKKTGDAFYLNMIASGQTILYVDQKSPLFKEISALYKQHDINKIELKKFTPANVKVLHDQLKHIVPAKALLSLTFTHTIRLSILIDRKAAFEKSCQQAYDILSPFGSVELELDPIAVQEINHINENSKIEGEVLKVIACMPQSLKNSVYLSIMAQQQYDKNELLFQNVTLPNMKSKLPSSFLQFIKDCHPILSQTHFGRVLLIHSLGSIETIYNTYQEIIETPETTDTDSLSLLVLNYLLGHVPLEKIPNGRRREALDLAIDLKCDTPKTTELMADYLKLNTKFSLAPLKIEDIAKTWLAGLIPERNNTNLSEDARNLILKSLRKSLSDRHCELKGFHSKTQNKAGMVVKQIPGVINNTKKNKSLSEILDNHFKIDPAFTLTESNGMIFIHNQNAKLVQELFNILPTHLIKASKIKQGKKIPAKVTLETVISNDKSKTRSNQIKFKKNYEAELADCIMKGARQFQDKTSKRPIEPETYAVQTPSATQSPENTKACVEKTLKMFLVGVQHQIRLVPCKTSSSMPSPWFRIEMSDESKQDVYISIAGKTHIVPASDYFTKLHERLKPLSPTLGSNQDHIEIYPITQFTEINISCMTGFITALEKFPLQTTKQDQTTSTKSEESDQSEEDTTVNNQEMITEAHSTPKENAHPLQILIDLINPKQSAERFFQIQTSDKRQRKKFISATLLPGSTSFSLPNKKDQPVAAEIVLNCLSDCLSHKSIATILDKITMTEPECKLM